MPVSRLRHIPGIGVDQVGDAADAADDPRFLRLENLDTDLPPPAIAGEVTHAAVDGGWSLLIDTLSRGLTPQEASQRLFTRSQVAATPMTGWGPGGDRYLRLVFANDPLERLNDRLPRVQQF